MYWSIDDKNRSWYHRKIKGLNYITYFFGFDICMISQQWIYRSLYYHVDQSNDSSIIWWLCRVWDFVWHILNLSSIIEVDQFLVTWKMLDRLMMSIWADFLMWYKKVGCWKYSKNSYGLCKNWTQVVNIKDKRNILI